MITPAKTRELRLEQYVDALIEYRNGSFSIKDLSLSGSIWTSCTVLLREAGMLIIDESRPNRHRYKLIVSREELRDWIEDRQMKKFLDRTYDEVMRI